MAKHTSTSDRQERALKAERDREQRMVNTARARNEGIREGLLMAMTAVHDLPGDSPMLEAIKTRGDRHFGDTVWQTKPRAR